MLYKAPQRGSDAGMRLERRRIVLQYGVQGFYGRVGLKSASARDYFIEYGADRENVRPVIDPLAADLLRRHITHRAHDHAGFCLPVGWHRSHYGLRLARNASVRELCETEIENFGPVVAADEDILRLEVSMNDSSLMGSCESLRNLLRVIDRLAFWQASSSQSLPQRLAVEQFRNHIRG